MLGLVVDCGMTSLVALQKSTIEGKGDFIRCPCELIDMPIPSWQGLLIIVLVLDTIVAITVAEVKAERCGFERWNNFHLNRVPLDVVPIWTCPLCEESSGGAFHVGCEHLSDEFAVKELLCGCHLTTDIRCSDCL